MASQTHQFAQRGSAKWQRGDLAQQRWAELLAGMGRFVVPVYALEGNTAATEAPCGLLPGGKATPVPDVLSIRDGVPTWHEVKAKAIPTWHRISRRWEHGIDYSLADEYSQLQQASGATVLIVVHEEKSPSNVASESALFSSDVWLYLPLDKALQFGEHRKAWPGGNVRPLDRGRFGQGGLLWDRKLMTAFEPRRMAA